MLAIQSGNIKITQLILNEPLLNIDNSIPIQNAYLMTGLVTQNKALIKLLLNDPDRRLFPKPEQYESWSLLLDTILASDDAEIIQGTLRGMNEVFKQGNSKSIILLLKDKAEKLIGKDPNHVNKMMNFFTISVENTSGLWIAYITKAVETLNTDQAFKLLVDLHQNPPHFSVQEHLQGKFEYCGKSLLSIIPIPKQKALLLKLLADDRFSIGPTDYKSYSDILIKYSDPAIVNTVLTRMKKTMDEKAWTIFLANSGLLFRECFDTLFRYKPSGEEERTRQEIARLLTLLEFIPTAKDTASWQYLIGDLHLCNEELFKRIVEKIIARSDIPFKKFVNSKPTPIIFSTINSKEDILNILRSATLPPVSASDLASDSTSNSVSDSASVPPSPPKSPRSRV